MTIKTKIMTDYSGMSHEVVLLSDALELQKQIWKLEEEIEELHKDAAGASR